MKFDCLQILFNDNTGEYVGQATLVQEDHDIELRFDDEQCRELLQRLQYEVRSRVGNISNNIWDCDLMHEKGDFQ